MRIRSVKPEFFKHDVLGAYSCAHRLLFIGLWCMADCAGRLEHRPARIKVEVLPYDDVDISMLLSDLEKSGFIVVYSVDDQSFIEIPSFLRHQRITGKESEASSRFPGIQKKKPGKQRGNIGETTGKQPDSLETEGRRKGNGDEEFCRFWNAYPKKKSKETAIAAFKKVSVPIEVLLSSIERFKADPDWIKNDGQFIPHPATWLNQKRWEDELELSLSAPKPTDQSWRKWCVSEKGMDSQIADSIFEIPAKWKDEWEATRE